MSNQKQESFRSLDDIKHHCDKVFPDTPPLKVDSAILIQPSTGSKTYKIVIYLMAPSVLEFVTPLKSRLEEIKLFAEASGFMAKSQYGRVQPVGYHFELSVYEKPNPKTPTE